MQIEGQWSASSVREHEKSYDLSALAGGWNTGVQIAVSNPACFTVGPINNELADPERQKPALLRHEHVAT